MLLIKFQNFEVQTMAKEEKLCKHILFRCQIQNDMKEIFN